MWGCETDSTLPLPPHLPAGFGWVRVLSPAGPLDVFNTHLHANYSHKVRAKAVAAAAAAAATRGKAGPKADPKATVSTTGPKVAAAATAAAAAAKRGKAGPKAGPTTKTAGKTAVASGDAPLGFDIPLDAFAPFRVSQICELAQVRREGGRDEGLKKST